MEHWHDQLHGIGDGIAGFPGQHLGISDKIAVKLGRQFHRRLDGFVVGDGAEFQLGHGQLL
ncbi:hypothetical protein JP74_15035 [Devosia sp. 17-2-E-8]|nr:hypothetical protein JP74_15035 [Devosia sp. 17-2-E-8]